MHNLKSHVNPNGRNRYLEVATPHRGDLILSAYFANVPFKEPSPLEDDRTGAFVVRGELPLIDDGCIRVACGERPWSRLST